MKHFAEFIDDLTYARNEDSKVLAIYRYFRNPKYTKSFAEVIPLLTGWYPRQIISLRLLKTWIPSLFPEYPDWLIEKSVEETGNIVNAIALLVRTDESEIVHYTLSEWLEKLHELENTDENKKMQAVKKLLVKCSDQERKLLLRLITGSFKTPVDQRQLIKGLAKVFGLSGGSASLRWHYMMKKKAFEIQELQNPLEGENNLLPTEIFEPVYIENPELTLGSFNQWLVYGVRSGIPCQIVKYREAVHLWSAEHDILTHLFPEIVDEISHVTENMILTGHLVSGSSKIAVGELEDYIRKGTTSPKSKSGAFIARDVFIRHAGEWVCLQPEQVSPLLGAGQFIRGEQVLGCRSWDELREIHFQSSEFGYDGIVLRNVLQPALQYIWRTELRRLKAVLMYVEMDRSGLQGMKSMTFGLFRGTELIPVAKVPVDYPDPNTADILNFVKQNTVQRFGPVRSVKATLVYEIKFEGITHSVRKKAGLSLQKPLLGDKIGDNPELADRMENLKFST